jgi:hypothetical protein
MARTNTQAGQNSLFTVAVKCLGTDLNYATNFSLTVECSYNSEEPYEASS